MGFKFVFFIIPAGAWWENLNHTRSFIKTPGIPQLSTVSCGIFYTWMCIKQRLRSREVMFFLSVIIIHLHICCSGTSAGSEPLELCNGKISICNRLSADTSILSIIISILLEVHFNRILKCCYYETDLYHLIKKDRKS